MNDANGVIALVIVVIAFIAEFPNVPDSMEELLAKELERLHNEGVITVTSEDPDY